MSDTVLELRLICPQLNLCYFQIFKPILFALKFAVIYFVSLEAVGFVERRVARDSPNFILACSVESVCKIVAETRCFKVLDVVLAHSHQSLILRILILLICQRIHSFQFIFSRG